MSEYQGNSHKERREVVKDSVPEKRSEKIITGTAVVRKKSGINKLSEIFFAKDLKSVQEYIFKEVLIPSLKKAAWEIFTNGLHMSLYGEPDRESKRPSTVSRVSYWSPSSSRGAPWDRRDDRRDDRPRRSASYSYDDILFPTLGDAELALDKMDEIMERYHLVRVADLFDMADLTCESTDYGYGWTDLTSAKPIEVRDGWMLKLPRAMPLD